MNTTANEPYKPLAAGDFVIVRQGGEYAGLVGQVTEIIKLGSPEHDTGNPTDDIVVDLSAAPYSDYKKEEIVAKAKRLGYEADSFEDVPLDGVILAPDDIIRITMREYEQYQTELTVSLNNAGKIGERLSSEHYDEMYKVLTDRVKQNYADYERHMLGCNAQDIFDVSARTHAVMDAYSYMAVRHNYSEDELRFFLQFNNPLDMVAHHRHLREMDISDMSFTIDFLMEPERQTRMLESYSLAKDAVPQTTERSDSEPPKPLTPREQFYKKLSAEFDAFIADLQCKTPNRILDSAYTKVCKEDILLSFEYGDSYSDEEIEFLLTVEDPLDELYSNWLGTDASHMDVLHDSISAFVSQGIERQNEINGVSADKEVFQHENDVEEPPPQVKPKAQTAAREPSLLDELHEAAREIEARKADKPAHNTKKHDRGIE